MSTAVRNITVADQLRASAAIYDAALANVEAMTDDELRGRALESALGPELAGRLIYEASTGRPAPDFFANTADALADIRRCAGLQEPSNA